MTEKSSQPITLPPITFIADGPTEEVRNANLEAVLPSPGFPEAAILIADAITKHSDQVLLDFTRDAVSVRYQVDGVWHPMPGKDRQMGDYMLASLKKLADLNYQERRARQEGEFQAKFHGRTTTCILISQGVKTGERVAIRLDSGARKFESLAEMGMRPKLIDQYRQMIAQDKGLILFSTLPGDGASALWNTAINQCDRLMRDFYAVESSAAAEQEIINVESIQYDRAAGEIAETKLPGLLLRQPDVICFSEALDRAKMVDTLTDLVLDKNLLIFGRVHARNAEEALLRTLVLKPNAKRFAESVQGVVYMRLFRRLCEHCKQSYQPQPALLQKLGIAAGRVQNFFREYQPPPPEEMVDAKGNPIPYVPCPYCNGIGYRERGGIFEVLEVNDKIRDVLTSKPSMQAVTTAAREHGHVPLKDEGIVQVAKGLTSLTELQRVLKK